MWENVRFSMSSTMPLFFVMLLGYVLFCFVVTLGSIATPSCYVMAKQMGHEGVLTGSVCVTTTLFSAFSLTFWLFLRRSMGCIA